MRTALIAASTIFALHATTPIPAAAQTTAPLQKAPAATPNASAKIPPPQPAAKAAPVLSALPALFSPSTSPGAWADYRINDGAAAATLRWTYLGPSKDGAHVFENFIASGGKIPSSVTQFAMTRDAAGKWSTPTNIIVQPAGGKPRRLDAGWARSVKGLATPDAKSLIGREVMVIGQEQVSVARYRSAMANQTMEYFLSESVAPIGVVKMTVTIGAPSPKTQPRKFTVELAALGTDGKSMLAGPPEATPNNVKSKVPTK